MSGQQTPFPLIPCYLIRSSTWLWCLFLGRPPCVDSTKFLFAQPQALRNPSWFAHGIVQMVEDEYAHMFQDAETWPPRQTV
ncbi:hypothetical protein HDV62DRAFT_367508 [Trichoderma sp. SZMC 28011]